MKKIALEDVLRMEVVHLISAIEDISFAIFIGPDRSKMVDDLQASMNKRNYEPDDYKEMDYKSAYLDTSEKINCAFAVHFLGVAMTYFDKGEYLAVIKQIADLNRFIGAVIMCHRLKIERSKSASDAAKKRHTENTAMKKDAIQYYNDNSGEFTNKDDAAYYISKNIVPMSFSTIRDWLKGV